MKRLLLISCSFLFAGCFSSYASSPTKHSISIIGSVLEQMNDPISKPSKLMAGSYNFQKPLKNNVDLRGQLCIINRSPPINDRTILESMYIGIFKDFKLQAKSNKGYFDQVGASIGTTGLSIMAFTYIKITPNVKLNLQLLNSFLNRTITMGIGMDFDISDNISLNFFRNFSRKYDMDNYTSSATSLGLKYHL